MIIKEIQGLRSISIILILLFHLEIPYFDFGFIGVDIFLVISGFIFSKIIINDYQKGDFKFSKYFNRRIKRLLPALLATLFFVTIVSWLFLVPLDLKYFGQSLFSSSLFLSNIYYYLANNDYFLPNSFSLIHLWSLSLEVQFYIIYPILFFFIYRYQFLKNKTSNIIFLLSILSFVANVLYSENEKLIFNFLPFRLWEFFFGYFIYDLIFNKKNILFSKKNYKLIFFILLVLIYLIFGNSSLIKHEVIAILSFFLILKVSFNKKNFLNKFLNSSFNQNIAKYSYSIFLVHFPIIYFGKYFGIYGNVPQIGAEKLNNDGLFLIIILIIFFSYFVFNVEKKFYQIGKNKLISNINIYLINFSLLIFLLLGLFFHQSKGIKFRYFLNDKLNSNYISKAFNYASSKKIDGMDCNIYCKKIIGFEKSLLLFGNSHAGDFEKALEIILKEKKINLYISYVTDRKKKNKFKLDYLSTAIKKDKVDYIYISHHPYNFDYDTYINKLSSIIKRYPHVEFYYFLPRVEFNYSPIKFKILKKDNIRIMLQHNEIISRIRKLNYNNFNIIDQNKILTKLSSPECDKLECFDGHDKLGMPLYRDNHHLTFYGANLLIKEIKNLKNY